MDKLLVVCNKVRIGGIGGGIVISPTAVPTQPSRKAKRLLRGPIIIKVVLKVSILVIEV